MAALKWDQETERLYETGVSNVVLFVYDGSTKVYGDGVAWNGVTSIAEKPSGAEATALYADNTKYLNLISNEEFAATIEAYMYPDEWAECDGSAEIATGVTISQQARSQFALAFMTKVGNDTQGDSYGYKIHIIYGCKAAPSERSYATINDSPEAITFSWEISTTPIDTVAGKRQTACVTIDSTVVNDETKMTALKNKLWGTDGSGSETGTDPELPTIAWLITNFGPTTGGGSNGVG